MILKQFLMTHVIPFMRIIETIIVNDFQSSLDLIDFAQQTCHLKAFRWPIAKLNKHFTIQITAFIFSMFLQQFQQ